ncbi:MAG: hypothetical protein CBC13_08950 [Planctomycetia bacterium TMED53]|nr:MAG: hypothetical protein CBC13_08950 [Planctomycetia bacterium TMED53]
MPNILMITGSKSGHLTLTLLAFFTLSLFVSAPLCAQNGTVLQQLPTCGTNPKSVDLTVRLTDGTLWGIDATSGKICVYSTTGPLAELNSFDHPIGAAIAPLFQPQCAGIAYSAATDTFWLLNSTGQELAEMDATGTSLGAPVVIQSASTLVGLALNPLDGNLWSLDNQNNTAIEIDPITGSVLTELSIPGNSVRYSSGLDIRLDNGNPLLNFSYGDVFDAKVVEILEVDLASGELTSQRTDLGQIESSHNVMGFTLKPASSSIYATTCCDVYEIDGSQGNVTPPAELFALVDGEGSTELSWRNCGPGLNGIYNSIRITRNGAIVDTISGSAASWTDNSPPNESGILYQVQGVVGSNLATSSVTVNNAPGGLAQFVSIPNFFPRDLAYDSVMDDLYVTDSFSGEIRVFGSDLVEKRVIDTGLSNLRGIGYNSLMDVLLVSRANSSLVTFIDPLTGVPASSFPSSSQEITSISYDVNNDDWLLFRNTGTSEAEVLRMDAADGLEGNPLGSISPPQTSGLVLSGGLASLDDGSLLLGVDSGGQATSISQLTSFGFPLSYNMSMSAIGNSMSELNNPWTGMETIGSTLIVAGNATSTLYKLILVSDGPDFLRGDSDGNGLVNLADAIYTASWLYSGGPASPCFDASDANDDGSLDISDPLYTLLYLFGGSAPPPSPFPLPGEDPTFLDNLGC